MSFSKFWIRKVPNNATISGISPLVLFTIGRCLDEKKCQKQIEALIDDMDGATAFKLFSVLELSQGGEEDDTSDDSATARHRASLKEWVTVWKEEGATCYDRWLKGHGEDQLVQDKHRNIHNRLIDQGFYKFAHALMEYEQLAV